MVPHEWAEAARARLLGRCFLFTAGILACCLLGLSPTIARSAAKTLSPETGKTSLEARRDALFQKMFSDPTNLDMAFAYATLSTRLGDYEGAITALERMLIFAPGLPRIQLELGVLYYRLGSYATAEDYFERALSGDNVPDIVRQRVSLYVSKIKNKQKRHSFSGSVMGGFRVQSNANSGPATSQINLNGVTYTLSQQNVEKTDANAFFASTLHYDYDLHRQGDLLEADFLFYGAKYTSLNRLDTGVAELTLGPSFNMQRFGIDKTQLGIYAIGNIVGLKDDLYFGTLGAGLRFINRTSLTRSFRFKTEYRHKWYNNTPLRPTLSNRNGHELSGELSASSVITPRIMAHGKVRLVRENVKAVFLDNLQVESEAGATFTLSPPFRGKTAFNRNWLLDLTGGYKYIHYDHPDPSINAAKKQKNNEYFARASLTIPVIEGINLLPQLEYRKVSSNYDIYKYDNFSAMLGIGYRF